MSTKRSRASPRVDLPRLNWVGPVAVLSSIASVLCVRCIGVALVRPDPGFLPLTVGPAVIDTAVLVTFAVLIFRRVICGGEVPRMFLSIAGYRFFTLEPIRAFRLIAFRALLLSFLPDVWVALVPLANWPYGLVLAGMHVAAWSACVTILTSLSKMHGKKTKSLVTDAETQ